MLTHAVSSRRGAATLILAALLLGALIFVSSGAAKQNERVGARINLFNGAVQVYPAGQPFHIAHGWGLQPDQSDHDALGKYGFSLAVDGGGTKSDFVEKRHSEVPPFGILQFRTWVHNFPSGLTGTHRFTGRWFGPCQGLVDAAINVGPCEKTNTTTTAIAPLDATVAFVPTPGTTNLALGKPVTASYSNPTNPPELAVDGSFWSYWSALFPPQWIEVDLGAPHALGQIVLSITQLPDSNTVHRVYGKAGAADGYELLQEFAGFTRDLDSLSFVPTPVQHFRFVRIETTSSASWVAWREIAIYAAS